ncbi:hypothetical protein SEA_EVEPICKLES_12 [Arthrobacter phage EvePickles]|nr:hypothetical protein SEA_EVEPICKLES_12 [Arthrobacter phage EvePickles]
MIIDTSGLDDLAGDIRAAPDALMGEVGKVVSKGALNIKQQIQRDFRGSRHFSNAIVANVRYNRKVLASSAEAEIAPYVDQEGFGSLVGIAVHGASRGGGGTVPDPIHALLAEAPGFEQALLNLAGTVLDE